MTAIIKRKGKWVVRDHSDEWEFDTHADAQIKANALCAQKLRDMSDEDVVSDNLREVERKNVRATQD